MAFSSLPGAVAPDFIEWTIRAIQVGHGAGEAGRIRRGVEQVAQRWWPEDGEAGEMAEFCAASFLADTAALEQAFERLERVLEQVDGHLHEVRRTVMEPLEVEPAGTAQSTADLTPMDRLLVRLDLAPHVDEDLFRSRIAFFALLNFPVHTLAERLALSPQWDRAAWARSRMMDRFASRVPAATAQAVTRAMTAAEEYVSAYNIRADRLVGADGERPFREGLRLISHWGLRDELAAQYADPHRDAALARQRLLLEVMRRIVRQEIPAAVIDNPDLLWAPATNTVRPATPHRAGETATNAPGAGTTIVSGANGSSAHASGADTATSNRASEASTGSAGAGTTRISDALGSSAHASGADTASSIRASEASTGSTGAGTTSVSGANASSSHAGGAANANATEAGSATAEARDDRSVGTAAATPPPAGLDALDGLSAVSAREADCRYAHLLGLFQAQRAVDPFTPTAPSLSARRFDVERQMPEAEVEALLVSVLEAPEVDALASEIARLLARPLEPFDIWYSGFKSRSGHGEQELDAKVRSVFPTLADFSTSLPELLERLGFSAERAAWLAARIVVDRARGAGHALGAVRREDRAHLRTRIADDGMDYKGYNVAMHELGHNVEQVFSLNGIDHWWLAGVPNNAFTEAFAFMFQERDLEMLGLGDTGAAIHRARALAALWNTYEISGVSLVDMRVWRWLYAHPDATPADLREATLAIAREVWNRFFAPRLGHPDCEILAIYSHMIAYALYLPDYAIGHIVAFQMAAQLLRPPLHGTGTDDGKGTGGEAAPPARTTQQPGTTPEKRYDFGAEVERCTRQGRLTPDAWMRGAVGGPVSADALLAAARHALGGGVGDGGSQTQ